jgi:hypothetical protein
MPGRAGGEGGRCCCCVCGPKEVVEVGCVWGAQRVNVRERTAVAGEVPGVLLQWWPRLVPQAWLACTAGLQGAAHRPQTQQWRRLPGLTLLPLLLLPLRLCCTHQLHAPAPTPLHQTGAAKAGLVRALPVRRSLLLLSLLSLLLLLLLLRVQCVRPHTPPPPHPAPCCCCPACP